MWVATQKLPRSPGHPFYERLNQVLEKAGFDAFVEAQGARIYAPGSEGRVCAPDGTSGCCWWSTLKD